jgi:hypothetical protein
VPFLFRLLLLTAVFLGSLVTGPLGLGHISQTKKVYYPPPAFFQYFSFGQNETLADGFWLRLIQDMDLCAQQFSNPEAGPEIPTTLRPVGVPKICNLSWAFRMFDIVTELAPRFRLPHAVGGLALSVLMEDYRGATYLFDKAVKAFPNDWAILYRASYHYMADLNDLEKAAELAQRAALNGAPSWLSYTSSRLYTKAGQKEMGLKVLRDYLEGVKDEGIREKIRQKIKEVEAQ